MANLVSAPAVVIAAPITEVWAVLTDFARDPEWNPFTHHVEATLRLGAIATLHVRMSQRHDRVPREVVTAVEDGRAFAWGPTLPRLLIDAARWQKLEQAGDGTTIYRTWESFAGPLAPLVLLLFRDDIERGFTATGQALKRRTESLLR